MLVRGLVRDQHPDLGDRPVQLGARGWDNQLWRLGDDLVVRLPWATESADALLRKEHTWVPTLAPRLPLPIPVPQRFGEPSQRFPRPRLITTWVPGTPADQAGRADKKVTGWAAGALAASMVVSVITIQELETRVLLAERRDPPQGEILRRWLEQQVLPAFGERILPVDTAVARRGAALHIPDPRPVRDSDFVPDRRRVIDPWRVVDKPT